MNDIVVEYIRETLADEVNETILQSAEHRAFLLGYKERGLFFGYSVARAMEAYDAYQEKLMQINMLKRVGYGDYDFVTGVRTYHPPLTK